MPRRATSVARSDACGSPPRRSLRCHPSQPARRDAHRSSRSLLRTADGRTDVARQEHATTSPPAAMGSAGCGRNTPQGGPNRLAKQFRNFRQAAAIAARCGASWSSWAIRTAQLDQEVVADLDDRRFAVLRNLQHTGTSSSIGAERDPAVLQKVSTRRATATLCFTRFPGHPKGQSQGAHQPLDYLGESYSARLQVRASLDGRGPYRGTVARGLAPYLALDGASPCRSDCRIVATSARGAYRSSWRPPTLPKEI